MKIENVPFCATDWRKIDPVEYKGEKGTSFWRTIEMGNIRVRKVEYSPGFVADHWCSRGHILLVVDGEMTVELKNGKKYHLTKGNSFQAEDDENNPHMAYSDSGARVFIVD